MQTTLLVPDQAVPYRDVAVIGNLLRSGIQET